MIETILFILDSSLIIVCFFLLRDKKALIAQNRRLIKEVELLRKENNQVTILYAKELKNQGKF